VSLSAAIVGLLRQLMMTTSCPVPTSGIRADYLRRNLYYAFSGLNSIPRFLEVLLPVRMDRMMFSTDHPHQSMTRAPTFLAGLPLRPHDRERSAHGRGERVMNI
jgi:predicted TIM-barrel fold metal-dependent hydrolase